MSNPSTTNDKPTEVARRQVRVRALGVAGALVAALAVWVVAVGILGVDLQVTPGTDEPQNVGLGSVLVVSLAASLAGWGLLELLERYTARPRRIWTVVALVALAVSLGGPLAGVTAAATVTLALLHLAVGVVLVAALGRAGTGPEARA